MVNVWGGECLGWWTSDFTKGVVNIWGGERLILQKGWLLALWGLLLVLLAPGRRWRQPFWFCNLGWHNFLNFYVVPGWTSLPLVQPGCNWRTHSGWCHSWWRRPEKYLNHHIWQSSDYLVAIYIGIRDCKTWHQMFILQILISQNPTRTR